MKGITIAIAMLFIAAGIYWLGGRENRAQDALNDKKGAEHVQTTTQDILDGLDVDADPDERLRKTDGLRDD